MQIPMRRRDHAHVHLPRRERPDALDLLMLQSAQQSAQILLGRHGWPGNVRELENVIGHAAMMVMGDTIDVRDLPEYLWDSSEHAGAEAEPPAATVDGVASLEDQERRLVVQALETAGGNQSQAARLLRIGRDALRYKVKKYGL